MAYTKEQLIDALQKAVGDTEVGQEIIKKAGEVYDETGKYSQDLTDRLNERIGIDEMWAKKDRAEGDFDKAAADDDTIAIVEKALDAIKAL